MPLFARLARSSFLRVDRRFHQWHSLHFIKTLQPETHGRDLGAGVLIVADLEDSVPRNDLAKARELLSRSIREKRFAGQRLMLRVNSEADVCAHDLTEVALCGVDGFLLPKIGCAADLSTMDGMVREVEARLALPSGHFKFVPIVETTQAIANLQGIAAHPRNIDPHDAGQTFVS